MDPTLSEVRLFAGNFAPLSWAFCNGALLSISNNTALFALIGTTYGGDGQTTFALPDFRGRVAIGTGTGPGLAPIDLGEVSGTENNTISISQMPLHNHAMSGGASAPIHGTITATMTVNPATGDSNPKSNFLADDSGGNGLYDASSSSTGGVTDTLNTNAIQVDTSTLSVNVGALTLANNGGSQPVNNMQPFLALNYIIAVEGIFPSRN